MRGLASLLVACAARGALVTSQLDPWREFDYIVVGGGGSGCVVARELSDSGYDTLLIERGDVPHKSGTRSLYGLRDALSDPKLAQPVITANGVRTAVANVLGGGTSVNLGIWIEENEEYYNALIEYLVTVTGAAEAGNWKALLSRKDAAIKWVRAKLTRDYHTQATSGAGSVHYPPHSPATGQRKSYASIMESILGDWYGSYVGVQPEIQPGRSWTAYSLFTKEDDGEERQRFSIARAVLEGNDHLTVLVNATVDSILPRRQYVPGAPNAPPTHEVNCVHYHQTLPHEPQLVGSIVSTHGETPQKQELLSRSALYIKSLQNTNRYTANDLMTARSPKISRKVCLKGTQKILGADPLGLEEFKGHFAELDHPGEIILSAGAIMSPWILFNSGIGPKQYTDLLGVLNYVDNPWIGQNIQDRPTVGVSIELRDTEHDLRHDEPIISHNVALPLKDDIDNQTPLVDVGVPNLDPPRHFRRPSGAPNTWRVAPQKLRPAPPPSYDQGYQEDMVWGEDLLPYDGNITDPDLGVVNPDLNPPDRRGLGVSNAFRNSGVSGQYYANYYSPASLFHRKTMGFEDLYGGDVNEGIIWQSRLLFPPELRNMPVADYVSDVLVACGDERRRKNRVPTRVENPSLVRRGENLKSLCRLESFIKPCIANAAVWFTFLTHVKSRGSIYVGNDGQLVVDPGYLTEELDRRELIQNVQSMFQMLLRYSGVLSNVFQPYTESQCPAHDFRTEQSTITSLNQLLMTILLKSQQRSPKAQQHVPFATEPQILPNVDDQQSIWEYVQNHMVSMWHLVGSISMGVVLDHQFHIPQVNKLSVIDASVLPIHTRMNPGSTILALAKMAVDHKLSLLRGGG